MHSYGVETVIDLRAPGERASWPSPVQGWRGYRARPVFDDAALEFLEERFSDDQAGFYVWALESRAQGIAAILKAIADAPPGGVVIHCGIGKDRTGIVAALLLALIEVGREAILSDFMLSGERLSPLPLLGGLDPGFGLAVARPPDFEEVVTAIAYGLPSGAPSR
jgi:hypothetical protein